MQRRCLFTELRNKYEYTSICYSRFSKEVAVDLNAGIDMGLISSDNSISLTPQGWKYASGICFSLGDMLIRLVAAIALGINEKLLKRNTQMRDLLQKSKVSVEFTLMI